MEMNVKAGRRLALDWFGAIASKVPTRYEPALPVLALLLAPVPALAGALGIWRVGADVGWTYGFFVPDGLLSHHQIWFAIAIVAQTSASCLNRLILARALPVADVAVDR